jgi:diaminopimelate epimerase
MSALRLEKWEGAGNAYLLLERDELGWPLAPAAATLLCDPRSGIGADGVLLLERRGERVRMTITNPDGSPSEACGNGTRMVARWLAQRAGVADVVVETLAGDLPCTVHEDGSVTATMATAVLEGPAYRPDATPFPYLHRFVSVGNPHVTIPVGDPDTFPLERDGPRIEHHAWLPERANVEIYAVRDRGHIDVRVWERGVGETRACGSGACAVAVAAVLDEAVERTVDVRLPGGTLTVEVGEDLSIRQTGPAEPIAEIGLAGGLAARVRGR